MENTKMRFLELRQCATRFHSWYSSDKNTMMTGGETESYIPQMSVDEVDSLQPGLITEKFMLDDNEYFAAVNKSYILICDTHNNIHMCPTRSFLTERFDYFQEENTWRCDEDADPFPCICFRLKADFAHFPDDETKLERGFSVLFHQKNGTIDELLARERRAEIAAAGCHILILIL